jgi:hypothetical protein
MRVYVSEEEWYPFYELSEDPLDNEAELTEDEYAWIQRVFTDLKSVQIFLRSKYHGDK